MNYQNYLTNNQISQLVSRNQELEKLNSGLNDKLQKVKINYEKLAAKNKALQKEKNDLLQNFQTEMEKLKNKENEQKIKIEQQETLIKNLKKAND